MKKFTLIVCCLLSMTGTVSAITYDFDSIPLEPGKTWKYYSPTEFNAFFTGVSFTNTTNTDEQAFKVQKKDADLEPDFAGHIIMNYPMKYHGTTIATFDTPVAFVSVTMGDRGIDDDKLYLKAYNSSGTLIGQDSYDNPWYSYAGHTLSVSSTSADIAWVEFYGWSGGMYTVYWDNFTFSNISDPDPDPDPDPSAVPEPGTLLLFGTGLLAMLAFVKRTLEKQ